MKIYGRTVVEFTLSTKRELAAVGRCLIDPTTGCWEWQNARTLGYGRIRHEGRLDMAHRVAYRLFVGPIGDGMQIDHLCSNRACVNPAHLEQVTPLVNQRRACPPQTTCHRGHDLTDSTPGVTGSRNCRKCQAIRRQAHAARQLAGAA